MRGGLLRWRFGAGLGLWCALATAGCRAEVREGNPTLVPAAEGAEARGPQGTTLPAALPRATAPLPVGAAAPPVRFRTATQSLDARLALQSGPVVLVFFIGEFCAYCRRQLSAFEQRMPEFRAAGAQVWAVSSDGTEALSAMRRELALSFPLASDASLEGIGAFGVESRSAGTALPSVFVLAPAAPGGAELGRVVFAQVGANQEDRASIDEVLAAVRAARRR